MASNYTKNNISTIEVGGIKCNLKSVPFHATEAEWLVINYIPKQAEIIVYDVDENYNYLRFKTGDGVTEASQLPFSLISQDFIESQGFLKKEVYCGTVTEVQAGAGLKITGEKTVAPIIEIDPQTIFVFDCGDSITNI